MPLSGRSCRCEVRITGVIRVTVVILVTVVTKSDVRVI